MEPRTREDWEREHQEAEAMYEIRYQAYQTASGLYRASGHSLAYAGPLSVLRLELGEAQSQLQRLDEEYNELSAEESPI